MAIFVTGTTGYIGSYVAHGLLTKHRDRLALLVRAGSVREAEERLWKSLQLHVDFDEFFAYMRDRIDIYLGDLTEPNLGLAPAERDKLIKSTDSVIHCAASLNRKSEKSCMNVNLRGTLEILKIARDAQDHHGLRRFSDISTVAVAGTRQDEIVNEDSAIDWNRSDYDPYARTKKFCEHMIHELLPDVPITVFRPSIVMGDSRFAETTQFDMVRAFVFLAQFPILPFGRNWRLDIVNADYVGRSIVQIHQTERPKYGIYHLASGEGSLTFGEILDAMVQNGLRSRHILAPWLLKPASIFVSSLMATPRSFGLAPFASMMKVFLPYLSFNTVFENSRVKEELGETPVPFKSYALPLFHFAKSHRFNYPYRPWGTVETIETKKAKVA